MIRELPRQAQLKDEEVPSCRSVAIGKVAANGGFHKYGYPNSWMVYFMENPTKMDENWGYPYFRKPPNHLCVIGLVCLRENLQQSQKPFLWERPWISSCVRLRFSHQSIESDVVNVNPGLINPKRLFNFGWYHLSIRWNDYWRSTPLINKPWFSLIRGWHYYQGFQFSMNSIVGFRQLFNGGLINDHCAMLARKRFIGATY